jgi:hypothetical protein
MDSNASPALCITVNSCTNITGDGVKSSAIVLSIGNTSVTLGHKLAVRLRDVLDSDISKLWGSISD